MEDKIEKKYLLEGIMQYFMNAGAGLAGVHDVVYDSNGYAATGDAYVYAIEMYTAGVVFTTLLEDGAPVAPRRLDPDGSGYPLGTIITGKFTRIVVATDAVCGIFIKKAT